MTGQYCDVRVAAADGEQRPAHRCVLAAACPALAEAVAAGRQEGQVRAGEAKRIVPWQGGKTGHAVKCLVVAAQLLLLLLPAAATGLKTRLYLHPLAAPRLAHANTLYCRPLTLQAELPGAPTAAVLDAVLCWVYLQETRFDHANTGGRPTWAAQLRAGCLFAAVAGGRLLAHSSCWPPHSGSSSTACVGCPALLLCSALLAAIHPTTPNPCSITRGAAASCRGTWAGSAA